MSWNMNESKVEMKWWFQQCSNPFSIFVSDTLFYPRDVYFILMFIEYPLNKRRRNLSDFDFYY